MRPFDHAWRLLKTGDKPVMEGFTAERENPSIEQIRAHASMAGFEPEPHSIYQKRPPIWHASQVDGAGRPKKRPPLPPRGYHAGGGYKGVKEQLMAEETPDYEKFPNYQSIVQQLGEEPHSSSIADYLTQRSEVTHPAPPM